MSDGDIVDAAHRTPVGLVDGGEHDGISSLGKTAPAVFQQIGLEQNAHRVLEFQPQKEFMVRPKILPGIPPRLLVP
jgi:hypothetical protein